MNLLNYSDINHSLNDISEFLKEDYNLVMNIASELEQLNLLTKI